MTDDSNPAPAKGRKAFGVVCILGACLVLLIAAAYYSNFRMHGATARLGSLGAIRSGLSIYYGNAEGAYPETLDALTKNGQYLAGIPGLPHELPHQHKNEVAYYSAKDGKDVGAVAKDTGKWGYVGDSNSLIWGTVFIDCTHTDPKGSAWSQY